MISYLKGRAVEVIKTNPHRRILILEVNQIGYEVQIPSRIAPQLPVGEQETVQVFTHLQIRDDQTILYGFSSAAERDLFRQLVGVSGIGSQSAIALIDTLGLNELVQAIVTSNIRMLIKTPGVGKKTAERISLELKTKLSQWRQAAGISVSSSAAPATAIQEDVEMTLLALGYTNDEIEAALSTISRDKQLLKSNNAEDWIKAAIAWLSD